MIRSTDILTGPRYAKFADCTISPPNVGHCWRPEQEWNPIKFSVEKHTQFLQAEKESIAALDGKKIIFIYADYLDSFFRRILPHLTHRLVLIVHGDTCFSADYFGFLEDTNVHHVFSTNCLIEHPKLTPIPLGVPEHHLPMLQLCMQKRNVIVERRMYANFNLSTNRRREEIMLRLARRGDVHYAVNRLDQFKYYEEIQRHSFIISPPGSAPDCFRTWEALYLGRTPIVERWEMGNPYRRLALEINDIGSPPSMDALIKISSCCYNDTRNLRLSYWQNEIKTKASEL